MPLLVVCAAGRGTTRPESWLRRSATGAGLRSDTGSSAFAVRCRQPGALILESWLLVPVLRGAWAEVRRPNRWGLTPLAPLSHRPPSHRERGESHRGPCCGDGRGRRRCAGQVAFSVRIVDDRADRSGNDNLLQPAL